MGKYVYTYVKGFKKKTFFCNKVRLKTSELAVLACFRKMEANRKTIEIQQKIREYGSVEV